MALDNTPGGASANTYATIAEADAYLATRPGASAWATLSDPVKEAALITACRLMDRTLPWNLVSIGYERSSTTQALIFPRPYTLNAAGDAYLAGVPTFAKEAQSEWAFALTVSDRLADSTTRGIAGITAGPLSIDFDPATSGQQNFTPEYVYFLLAPWLLSRSALGSVAIARA